MGERSPNYFVEKKIPRRIKMYNENAKIVLMLCEPAARAYSDYTHFTTNIQDQEKNPQHRLLGLVPDFAFRQEGFNFSTIVERAIDYFAGENAAANANDVLGDLGQGQFRSLKYIWHRFIPSKIFVKNKFTRKNINHFFSQNPFDFRTKIL